MIKIRCSLGEFEIKDGVYTGPPELEGLFDIVRQRAVSPWEGPNDFAHAMRMVGDDPCEILEYDPQDEGGVY